MNNNVGASVLSILPTDCYGPLLPVFEVFELWKIEIKFRILVPIPMFTLTLTRSPSLFVGSGFPHLPPLYTPSKSVEPRR